MSCKLKKSLKQKIPAQVKAFTTQKILQLSDENYLSTAELSTQDLYTLFLTAKNTMPQSSICTVLKRRLFDLLWQTRDYKQLECVLKAVQIEQVGIATENLSKLVFFQLENKLTGNIAALVGQILTGGACLILRNAIYHNDIANAISFLANEIKLLFATFDNKNRAKLAWNSGSLENFIDHEASVLSQVLQLAVHSKDLSLDIIPTPSYLLVYDVGSKRVDKQFLPWLAAVDQELVKLYKLDTYNAVLLTVSSGSLSTSKSILKLPNKDRLHPYLRLALMLRAASVKNFTCPELVAVGEIASQDPQDVTTKLFKQIAIQTMNSVLNTTSEINLTAELLQQLRKTMDNLNLDQVSIAKTSALSLDNPFNILNVPLNATKPVIMQQVMQLIRQMPDRMSIFRQAQNELFNSARRFLHHYLRYFNAN